jgi:hypothetical protein
MTTRCWRISFWAAFAIAFGLPLLGAVGSLLLDHPGVAIGDGIWAAAIGAAFGVWRRA